MNALPRHFPGRPCGPAVTPPPIAQGDDLTDGMDEARGVIVGVGWAAVALTVFVSACIFLWHVASMIWAWLT